MSRDSSGTYTLPGGNPVITGTTISSTWANSTLNDVASALTDSLSRSGLGGMTSGLKLAAGSSGAPSLTWSLESTSGLYRNGAGDFRWVISGNEVYRITSSEIELEDVIVLRATSTGNGAQTPSMEIFSSWPTFNLRESDASANNRIWSYSVQSEQLRFAIATDAGAITNWLTVDRTAGTVDQINFPNGTLQYGGVEVGYRGIPRRTVSASDNTVAADAGRMIYINTAAIIFTIDTDLPDDACLVVMNISSGSVTIAESLSGSMWWMNGAGVVSSGNRSLAVAGVATVWRSGNDCYIWGSGLT